MIHDTNKNMDFDFDAMSLWTPALFTDRVEMNTTYAGQDVTSVQICFFRNVRVYNVLLPRVKGLRNLWGGANVWSGGWIGNSTGTGQEPRADFKCVLLRRGERTLHISKIFLLPSTQTWNWQLAQSGLPTAQLGLYTWQFLKSWPLSRKTCLYNSYQAEEEVQIRARKRLWRPICL